MPTWTIQKYVTDSGKCPIDKWKSKELTAKDRMRLRAEIEAIERVETLKPNTIEKYAGTEVFELKVRGDGKMLRPFGIQRPDRTFLLLSGAIEKDWKIPQQDVDRAERLRTEFEKGKGSVKGYFED